MRTRRRLDDNNFLNNDHWLAMLREMADNSKRCTWRRGGAAVASLEQTTDMSTVRIALANLRQAKTPEESVTLALEGVAEAGRCGALVVCFPECFIPGYRWSEMILPAPDPDFLNQAWEQVALAAQEAQITVVLGTERVTERGLQITACVIDPQGAIEGWQDKQQLDPSEEPIYPAMGTERHLFSAGPLTFGIAICHEGFRYPETVRWAARRGAQVVFQPFAHPVEPGGYRPATFADPANSFHEKAILCRAAENTCYVAAVNYASEGSAATSVVARPDGAAHCFQPYGQEGLLVADLDLSLATGLLASRLRVSPQ